MTHRIYLDDAYQTEFEARIVSVDAGRVALTATAFYPGGGGQPSDQGVIEVGEAELAVADARAGDGGQIWHQLEGEAAADARLEADAAVRGRIDWTRRYALMRHHTLLHIVNALVLAEHGGLITGVQIGERQSRIDFRVEGFAGDRVAVLEARINEVIALGLDVDARFISADEFRSRPELVRTATVLPPVGEQGVRVVALGGFDAQACGGTHVRNTRELGPCTILRTENKGKSNKRLYLTLAEAAAV